MVPGRFAGTFMLELLGVARGDGGTSKIEEPESQVSKIDCIFRRLMAKFLEPWLEAALTN